MVTVSPETFSRVLFLRNLAYAKFRKNKILANEEIILPFSLILENHALVAKFKHGKYAF